VLGIGAAITLTFYINTEYFPPLVLAFSFFGDTVLSEEYHDAFLFVG
jgi:hypothetical protein